MYEQLKQLMARKFQLDPDQIQPHSTLEDLELDSLDRVELALALDQEIGVQVSDDDLTEETTVEIVLRLIDNRGAKV